MGDLEETILVGDLVKFLARGDGKNDSNGPHIGDTGKVINIGKHDYGTHLVKLDSMGHPFSEWWTIPSKLKVLGHAVDVDKPVPTGMDLAEPPAAWDLTETTTSLSGSPAVYARCHVRIEGKGLRFQGVSMKAKEHKWEDSYSTVTAELRAYVATLPMVCPSVAGTGTMYARCLIRRDGSKPYAVRVQIAGPKLNREWGAEFVLANMSIVSKLPPAQPGDAAQLMNAGEPAETSPTSQLTTPVDMAALAVGDKLIVLASGDALGDGGGPTVGYTVTVADIQPGEACGPVQVTWKEPGSTYPDHWWTPVEKLGVPVPVPVFKVGDLVVIVKGGDGDGCKGGPAKGSTGVVHMTDANAACGNIMIAYGTSSAKWTTTPAHLAHSPVKPKTAHVPKSDEVSSPPQNAKWPEATGQNAMSVLCLACGYEYGAHYGGAHSPICPSDKYPTTYPNKLVKPKAWTPSGLVAGACGNCGQTAGKHYSGGGPKSGEHFDPPLCPDSHAVCPKCGPCGPQPMAIHTLHGVCKGKVTSKAVPNNEVPF